MKQGGEKIGNKNRHKGDQDNQLFTFTYLINIFVEADDKMENFNIKL